MGDSPIEESGLANPGDQRPHYGASLIRAILEIAVEGVSLRE